MIKNKLIGAIALSTAVAAGSAFAGSCPVDMRQIDAAMANSSLGMAEMEKVKALRAEGEKLHKSGDHSGSVSVLREAKDLLGI